ncbi:hypothetical protein ACIO3O_01255 [Streptomyces sp. NPDC087440]|uniref:hypothetical protein n=1 Tax=Streptomyces sp. NPDC087440 TaxID=3365790 RepID=UPI00381F468D
MSASSSSTGGGTVDLDGACRALDRGAAVVLPNPAPLTCVVAATAAPVVNEAKGRPRDQPVALWAHSPDAVDTLAPFLGLGEPDGVLLRRLLSEELLTVLVPLAPEARRPEWLRPASKDGWALLFGARWRPLAPLLDRFPLLYVSSANRTGQPPAADVEAAVAMFPATTAVLGEPLPPRTGGAPRAATTTVRLHRGGRLELHRHGAQDRTHPDAAAYLTHLGSVAEGRPGLGRGETYG